MERLKKYATPKMIEILNRLELRGVKIERLPNGSMQINPDYENGNWKKEEWKEAKSWLLNDSTLKNELIKILRKISSQNQEEKLSIRTIQNGKLEIEYIESEDISLMSFENYAENQKLQILLLINLKSEGKNDTYNVLNIMVRCGSLLVRDKGKLKILPIIGKGHWTINSWKKFRNETLKYEFVKNELADVIQRLEEGKLHYDACVMQSVSTNPRKPVCKFKADCIFCDCGYAASKYLDKIKNEYERYSI